MKNKRVIKQMSRFKVIVDETLLSNIPPVVLFDLYELNDDQINYLYERLNEIYNTDSEKDKELDSFYIPEKDRRLIGYNLNFLFQKLETLKKSNLEQEYQNIREEIIARNITLVKDCVKKLFKDIPLPKEDAMMFGVEGLLIAVDSYNLDSKTSFYAYAIKHIVLNIQNHFNDLIGITYKEYKHGANIPTIPVSILTKVNSPVIIGDQLNDYEMPTTFEDYEEIDALEDEELSDYGIEVFDYDNKELKAILEQIFKTLKPEQSAAVKKYFGFDNSEHMTYVEISKQENVSLTTARNRVTCGLRYISKLSKQLKEFSLSYENWKYFENTLREKNKKEYSIKYMRICELLIHNISTEAFPNFMKMAGLELDSFTLEPYNIEELVNDIEEICDIAKEENFNLSCIYYRVQNRPKINKIYKNVYEFICQNYTELKTGITNFKYDMYKSKNQKIIGYHRDFDYSAPPSYK